MEKIASGFCNFFNFNSEKKIELKIVAPEPSVEIDPVDVAIQAAVTLTLLGQHDKALEMFFEIRKEATILRNECIRLQESINSIGDNSSPLQRTFQSQKSNINIRFNEIENMLLEAAVDFITDGQVEFGRKILEYIEYVDSNAYQDGRGYSCGWDSNAISSGAYQCLRLMFTEQTQLAVQFLDTYYVKYYCKAIPYFLGKAYEEGKYGLPVSRLNSLHYIDLAEQRGFQSRIAQAKREIAERELEKYHQDISLILFAKNDGGSFFHILPPDVNRIIILNRTDLYTKTANQ